MLRTLTVGLSVTAALIALIVGWAYLHRALWYGQDFRAAFEVRIRSELVPGERAEFDTHSVLVKDVGVGRRLVCGTVRIEGGEDSGGPARYGVEFWPTLFGGGVIDVASPRVSPAGGLSQTQPIC